MIKDISIIPVVITITNLRTTTIIVDIENTPMTAIVTTGATIIKAIVMIIGAIGGLGSNGMTTQENTRTYTNMEHTTTKVHI